MGNAISRGNEEAEAALERKLLYVSLPEILKEHFLRGRRNLVVSGTHGKTTTSSILAWLLKSAGVDPSYMIGGIPRNLGQGATFTDSDFVVLEGDEYDTAFFDKRSKFLHYLPEVVVINNIEFDHADIYNSLDEIKLTFKRLLNIVPRNGMAFVNGDCVNTMDVASDGPAPITTVGLGAECDLQITDVDYGQENTSFVLDGEHYVLPMAGEFNVRNAAMAICAARFSGFSADQIDRGLSASRALHAVRRCVALLGAFGSSMISPITQQRSGLRLIVCASSIPILDFGLFLNRDPIQHGAMSFRTI